MIKPQTSPDARRIDPNAFIAQNAVVIGDVEIGSEASVWFSSVIRGDVEKIRIGARTNIQDGSVLHADPGFPCILDEEVIVGHRCVIHGARIHKRAMIGMGAVILNGAEIGEETIIGAGALIAEGKVIPPRSLVVGVPGKVVRPLNDQEVALLELQAQHYVDSGIAYKEEGYEDHIPPAHAPKTTSA